MLKKVIKGIVTVSIVTGLSVTTLVGMFGEKAVELFDKVDALEQNTKTTPAVVKRVVDGDTLVVTVNKKEEKVRLIGVDTPESVHPDANKNTAAGKTASAFTKSIVKKGSKVYLQKDVSNRDKYNRLLRYVWIKKPTGKITKKQIQKKMLNGILVKKGYAVPKRFPPNVKYAKEFEALAKK